MIPAEYKLTQKQIKKIQSVYPVLKAAADAASIPWQMVAAIWFRESFSVSAPKTPGGPFQFDPAPGPKKLQNLLCANTKLDRVAVDALVAKGVDDFGCGAHACAAYLRQLNPKITFVTADAECIKDAFYGYNGRAYGRADRSPYVMNGVDEAHKGMRLRGTIPDGKGGRTTVDIEDKRPGAYCVYLQLKELFP